MTKNEKIKISAILICVLIWLLCSSLFTVTFAEESEYAQVTSNSTKIIGSDVLYANGILIKGESQSFALNKNISNFTSVKFIPNANYFLLNPKHAKNTKEDNSLGTCTTVAAQLLLGYHNYYSDRRIIIPQSADGISFLSGDYGELQEHPLIQSEPAVLQGSGVIGTEDTVYQEIFNRIENGDGLFGQFPSRVVQGVENFLNDYADLQVLNNIYIAYGGININQAHADIDAGNPVIVVGDYMDLFTHVMVAYGYATYNGVDGFLVHCGWGDSATLVWVPNNLLRYQIRMSVNHTHNLVDEGNYKMPNYRKLSCSECKFKTVDYLYEMQGSILSGVKYPLSGGHEVTNTINIYEEESASFKEVKITAIGDSAFANQTQITKVDFPVRINSIGDRAFLNCTSLKDITLPSENMIIGDRAFEGCTSLPSINLVGAQIIGESAFANCTSLSSINLERVQTIGESAFQNCTSLSNIVGFESVNSIGERVFLNCTALTAIYIPSEIEYVGSGAFAGCNNLNIYMTDWQTSVNYIIGIENGYSTNILYNINKTKVITSGNVVSNVILPDTVTEIGESAFQNCTSLSSISLGQNVSIGESAFANCTNLSNIIGFNNVERISERAFLNCTALTAIYIPSEIEYVGGGAFAGCNNLNIYMTDWQTSVNYIIGIENGYSTNILYNINKTKVITSGNVASNVILPNTVTEIGEYAFYNNSELYNIEINSSPTIRSDSFANCPNLNTLTINSEIVPYIELGAFDNTYFSLYVPSGYESDFYEAFHGIADNIPIYEKEYNIKLICSITGETLGYAGAYFLGEVTLTHIPIKEHYEVEGVYDMPNAQGNKYVSVYYNASTNRLESEGTSFYWQQHSNGTLYVNWKRLSGEVACNIVANGNFLPTKNVTLTSGIGCTITAPTIDGYTFDHWTVYGSNHTTASISITVTLHRSYSSGQITLQDLNYPTQDDYITIYYNQIPEPESGGGGECVAQGTLITLADGRQVPVESLTGNERLLVWNLKTGRFDTAPILFIDREDAKVYDIINLYFSDGTHVKVIDEHAFFDFNLNRYVFLRSDASNYIGHYFNKQVTDENGAMIWARVQLVNVTITEEYTTAWSPVTYEHLSLYVNGMLSIPGGIEGIINTYAVDGNTMKIDQALYLQDVETYGLFTYEEFYELYPIPQYMFEALGGENLKVAIGKGYITHETIRQLIERYAVFFE